MIGVNSLCKLSWNTIRYLSIIVVQRGYRKGLVDATSGFCLKTPFRKTMATDVCYVSAQNVYEFIWEKMKGDERHFYEYLEFSSELSKEQLTIPGSRKC